MSLPLCCSLFMLICIVLPRYTSNATHFHCLGDSRAIPFSAVNDEYCDCDDGSDEPGTSACEDRSTGFYCANVGHIPGIVLASRVNDGLCDEECCDGTDEWATGACPDRCDKIGMEYRAKVEAEAKTRKTVRCSSQNVSQHSPADHSRGQRSAEHTSSMRKPSVNVCKMSCRRNKPK